MELNWINGKVGELVEKGCNAVIVIKNEIGLQELEDPRGFSRPFCRIAPT